MNNPYATIPLNQPNRDELIRVLEHIRVNEPETFERNVRECSAVVPAPNDQYDSPTDGIMLHSFSSHQIRIMSDADEYKFRFRIKTRKP